MTERKYLYQVGDIIEMKNGKVKVLALGKYKSGGQNYRIQCLKCGHIRTTDKKGIINKSECQQCSKNKFILSDDNTYWIGFTQKGEEFWFNGDKNIITYIKSYTWRENCQDYFQNKKGERLHRVVMGITNPDIFVNHLGRNKFDNRKENLTISNSLDNSKEKSISSRNNSGIVGLMARGDKWVGNIKINNINVYTKYKIREEALIDLLIIQKYYGFRHNIDLYYLLDDINQERIDKVVNNIKRQLKAERNDKIISSNRYELSECGTYYNVFDKNNKYFKIDKESKNIIENGIWHVAYDKNNDSTYVHGTIIIDRYRKTVKLHRYLFDLIDIKYKNIFVDHLNGDGLDNRIFNLELTNASGNGKNKPAKGYHVRKNGTFRASITISGKCTSKTFKYKEDAINWYNEKREESMKNRLIFKSKEEIDKYLNGNFEKAV